MHPAIAALTLASVLLLATLAFLVGRARGRYGVRAPATTGHEGFERVFRAQQNTHESMVMFLPALWVAASVSDPRIAAGIGLAWWLSRVAYAVAYATPGGNRGPAFVVSVLAIMALVAQAAWGLVALP